MEKNIAVIWGDCSSPEIVKQTIRVLDKVAEKYGHTFHYTDAAMGGEAIDKYGDPLPQHELDKCLAADSVLLGAVGGPKWEGLPGEQRPEKGLLRLRAGMGLYSNNRPAKIWPQLAPASPLKPEIVAQGIDFIIDGHSHTVMTKGENGEPIQSTGTAFANIGLIVIDDATKKIEKNELLPVYHTEKNDEGKDVSVPNYEGDATVAAAAQTIIDRVMAEYGAVFAKSEVELNGAKAPNGNRDSETNNGDLIADAMVWQVMQNQEGLTVDADHVVAITNGGGIRAAIKAGDITKNDINTVLPFGNTISLVYISGAKLLEALEASTYCTPNAVGAFPQVSGLKFTVDTGKAYDANAETYPGSTYYGPKTINRVTIESVNGKEFKADDTYAVITNNFCAGGGDTYYAFASAETVIDTGIPMDVAVMDYITTQLKGVVGETYAKPQGRITVVIPETPVEPEQPEQPEQPAETYVVVKGDSLWKIAKKLLGDGAQWKAIFDANAATVKDANRIYVGQTLNIPR